MKLTRLDIPDLILVEPKRHGDNRGFFSEVYKRPAFADFGIDIDFMQDNQSLSVEPGVVRGLHFQAPPHAQAKLVRVLKGAILDVAVDIRRGSPTYGRHVAVELSAENFLQLLVPVGFAHGFCTLAPNTEVLYKVSDGYSPECEGGIAWNDPAIGIAWPVSAETAVLSAKDKLYGGLDSFETPFVYDGSAVEA
ncbi:dTDP-4-dehydrorhamnose 3,5-epimerase [Kaistia dalseonensis]|uniref:dTDP-4-dehydrorhamnose 3,5-epimerase n=1 Tax=Kaistia dalseonensis TaxID=410840 RepID=A0ABU0H942_9HYPH|nr:dTDP-4-dehydrorhamnose 3,5-epimerase [Kaistia dalseonensis]MCX5495671.1 dTDP-4-dehydrorhamnose 3,5-epimerase [Kaistia dalseonensis]MDQ0438265.1 dTDP-4-dehydrorhamnose 3,5-epimerase [Kaistia dalseonensis]